MHSMQQSWTLFWSLLCKNHKQSGWEQRWKISIMLNISPASVERSFFPVKQPRYLLFLLESNKFQMSEQLLETPSWLDTSVAVGEIGHSQQTDEITGFQAFALLHVWVYLPLKKQRRSCGLIFWNSVFQQTSGRKICFRMFQIRKKYRGTITWNNAKCPSKIYLSSFCSVFSRKTGLFFLNVVHTNTFSVKTDNYKSVLMLASRNASDFLFTKINIVVVGVFLRFWRSHFRYLF